MSDTRSDGAPTTREPSYRWVVPLILGLAIFAPIAILIISNTDSTTIAWAGFEWEGPTWVVLFGTFIAGLLASPLFGWSWRRWHIRRRRRADEREVLRKHE